MVIFFRHAISPSERYPRDAEADSEDQADELPLRVRTANAHRRCRFRLPFWCLLIMYFTCCNQMGREALEGLCVSPKTAASRKINKQIISHPVT